MEVVVGIIVVAVVILAIKNQEWIVGVYRDLFETFESGNGNGNNAPVEEKLRKIVNNIVQNNKQFKDFTLEVSKAGLDTKRYNVRAFGHLVLLRHQKGAAMTKEDIRAKLNEYGI